MKKHLLTRRQRWGVRLVALFALAAAIQIGVLGEIGAVVGGPDTSFQFQGGERLFALYPFFVGLGLGWVSFWKDVD